MKKTYAARLLQFIALVFIGPFWTIPRLVWQRIARAELPTALKFLLAAPGACALLLFTYGLAQGWPVAAMGPGIHDGLRGYSPIHRACDEWKTFSYAVQVMPWLPCLVFWLVAWVRMAFATTILLGPLFLVLARREPRLRSTSDG